MEKLLYHQSQNTNDLLLTSYPYDYNHWEFGAPHFHKNYEILVAARGSFDCFIGDKQFFLQEGDAILIMPFQIHGLHVHDGALVWCSTFAERFMKSLAVYLTDKRAPKPVFHPDRQVTAFFLDQMDRYIGRRKQLDGTALTKLQETVFKGCIYAMGAAFLEQVELLPSEQSSETLADQLVQYIADNFKSDISLQQASEHIGYNYQYLSKVFNQTFGISFKRMLMLYRLDHAVHLLSETEMRIAEVAFESGFQSVRSFDHACLSTYHRSPKEIRRTK